MARRWLAAVVMMILGSFVVIGDAPGVATSSDPAAAPARCEARPGNEPDGLCMRRAFERGKVPVVLIHGLWGNPHQWDRMIEELAADPALGGRYQFWTFTYATGDPIPYSSHLLRQSLRWARRRFDPEGTDSAFDRMVLVGHSLGGILSKMMARNSGSCLWRAVSAYPPDRLAGPPEDRRLIREVFCYESVTEVKRIIFIATPHRGTPIGGGLVRDLGVRLCRRPSPFHRARESLLASNGPDVFSPGFLGEPSTSVGELAWEHPLLRALGELGLDPTLRSHSIIAGLGDAPGSDGIVPYASSHLDGAASELLVRGHHACLDDPAVIREARRILAEHAGIDVMSGTEHRESDRGSRVLESDS